MITYHPGRLHMQCLAGCTCSAWQAAHAVPGRLHMQCHTEEMGSTASDGRHSSDTCCKHRLHMSPKHAPPPVSPCAADRSLVRSSDLGPYLNLHCGGKMHALKPLPAVLPYWQYTQDVLQARPRIPATIWRATCQCRIVAAHCVRRQ
jgi:hypothetical protein